MRAYGVKVIIVEPSLYNTGLANLEIGYDKVKAAFNRLTPAIREEWGETFVNDGKSGLIYIHNNYCGTVIVWNMHVTLP